MSYANQCICCGAIIPEGLQVCPLCEESIAGKMIIEKNTVKEAVVSIVAYCKQQPCCEGCWFLLADDSCLFARGELPSDWRC